MKWSFLSTKCIIILFLLTPLLVPVVHAQYGEKDFIRYEVKEGLSDNNVKSIHQDQWGYTWIGTDIGLNRFDGYQFKNYFQHSADLPLASSNIRKVLALRNHGIGIVTSNGFQVLNTCNGTVENYFIPDTTSFVTTRNKAWDFKELLDGSFAITTASGFYHFNKDGSIAFRHDKFGIDDVGNKRIFYGRNIFYVSENDLLIYVGEIGLAHYDPLRKVFSEVTSNSPQWRNFRHPSTVNGPWVSKSQISKEEFIFLPRADSIIYYHHLLGKRVASPLPFYWADEFTWESNVVAIDDSTLLINSGYSGFYSFHLDRRSGVIICDLQKRLESKKVNDLFQDKDKRLWVGTTQGLYQQILRPGFIRKFNWPVGDYSIMGYIDGLYYRDKLYLARYSRDAGLIIIDTSTMEIEEEIHFFGKENGWNEVLSMAMYHPDTLWIGSFEGLLWFDTKSHRYGKVSEIRKIPKGIERLTMLESVRADGYAWMLRYMEGVVARYHPGQGSFEIFTRNTSPALPFNHIKAIVYDAFGDVWISGHSLARWNNRESTFDTLITIYGGVNKFNDDILVMTADDKGSLWLHNVENGLLEYKIKEKKFLSYGMKDGLPSDVLRCFSPVINHSLWMGSHNHLTRFDTETKKMEVYGYQEGLPAHMPVGRKIIADASNRNLLMFYVDEAIQFPVNPDVYQKLGGEFLIEQVVVNNNITVAFPDHTLKMRAGENNISVQYTIVDFENNHNYQFAYKLNGDDQWTSLGQQRTISLNNLSPGSYNLQLSARGKTGQQKIKTFSFSISPPFWKSTWFILALILVSISVVYMIYRFRISQIRQKANVDKLLSQTEMKALHAQMNPHFIFNSLNSIREMILHDQNIDASKYLSKFARLIRLTLDQSGQSFISLRNTIEYLQRYIEMEKIRNHHFTCHITVDPNLELDDTVLPPMLIQPFIENAIWHGTSVAHKNIDIQVRFAKTSNQLVCVVEDNGIGFETSMSTKNDMDRTRHSVGISNIKSRIQLLNKKHNLQSSVTVEDKSRVNGKAGTGTRVTLCLPLEMISE